MKIKTASALVLLGLAIVLTGCKSKKDLEHDWTPIIRVDQVPAFTANAAAQIFTTAETRVDYAKIQSYSWTKVSGPGNVTFSSTTTDDPTVTFSTAGDYKIKLVAQSSIANKKATKEISITVGAAIAATSATFVLEQNNDLTRLDSVNGFTFDQTAIDNNHKWIWGEDGLDTNWLTLNALSAEENFDWTSKLPDFSNKNQLILDLTQTRTGDEATTKALAQRLISLSSRFSANNGKNVETVEPLTNFTAPTKLVVLTSNNTGAMAELLIHLLTTDGNQATVIGQQTSGKISNFLELQGALYTNALGARLTGFTPDQANQTANFSSSVEVALKK